MANKYNCPDCGGNPDDAADAGCPTCEDCHTYDNQPDWCTDTRFDAWEGVDDWDVGDDFDDFDGLDDEAGCLEFIGSLEDFSYDD